MLEEYQPTLKSKLMYEDHTELNDEKMRENLWEAFAAEPANMADVRENFAPGQMDFDDDYQPV